MFRRKLRSRWSGPFTVVDVKHYRAITHINEKGEEFTVNGQRVKHYWAKPPISRPFNLGLLPDNSTDRTSSQAQDLKKRSE